VVEGGGRVMFFDLTGGPTVRLGKERAMVGSGATSQPLTPKPSLPTSNFQLLNPNA